jgi:hypothetical protein
MFFLTFVKNFIFYFVTDFDRQNKDEKAFYHILRTIQRSLQKNLFTQEEIFLPYYQYFGQFKQKGGKKYAEVGTRLLYQKGP